MLKVILLENNIYYIDIEEDNNIHKYILDDYIENIKKTASLQVLLR